MGLWVVFATLTHTHITHIYFLRAATISHSDRLQLRKNKCSANCIWFVHFMHSDESLHGIRINRMTHQHFTPRTPFESFNFQCKRKMHSKHFSILRTFDVRHLNGGWQNVAIYERRGARQTKRLIVTQKSFKRNGESLSKK